MNGRFQMQRGKNWILPKDINVNRFFWNSHWLKIWTNHFCPSMGPNGGSVAMESGGEFVELIVCPRIGAEYTVLSIYHSIRSRVSSNNCVPKLGSRVQYIVLNMYPSFRSRDPTPAPGAESIVLTLYH
jgi:hypothetical protein